MSQTNKLQLQTVKARAKKIFLWSLIGSLSVSALIAITVFIVGSFGETQGRLLLSTLAIGLFSLTALCSSTLYDQHEYSPLATAGLVISALGLFFSLSAIWASDPAFKPLLTFLVLAVGLAHASLILRIPSANPMVHAVIMGTLTCIGIVAAMLLYLILATPSDLDPSYYRMLGVFGVLDVLGTIVTPILKKIAP